jgi:ADP-ribose pyrophosphatase YjhB (NUDIX family)
MNFEIIVRGIIIKNRKILVCKNKKKDFYYFPGGHVEPGESAEYALVRELKEELNLSVKKLSFMGAGENVYKDESGKHHEVNLIFEVKAGKVKDKSMENHIDFFFFDVKRFTREKFLPAAIKKSVLKWLKEREVFWIPFK